MRYVSSDRPALQRFAVLARSCGGGTRHGAGRTAGAVRHVGPRRRPRGRQLAGGTLVLVLACPLVGVPRSRRRGDAGCSRAGAPRSHRAGHLAAAATAHTLTSPGDPSPKPTMTCDAQEGCHQQTSSSAADRRAFIVQPATPVHRARHPPASFQAAHRASGMLSQSGQAGASPCWRFAQWESVRAGTIPENTRSGDAAHRALGPSEAAPLPKVSGSGRLDVSCPKAKAGPPSSSPCESRMASAMRSGANAIRYLCHSSTRE